MGTSVPIQGGIEHTFIARAIKAVRRVIALTP